MAKEKSLQKTHRSLELLDTLRRLGGSARTTHLADTMDVSEETVRRTVKKLSKDGMVSRVHGGVFLAGETLTSGFHQRMGEKSREKKRMAATVASLIPNGASLFMDVGSTTTFVAEALRAKENLLVVTNSLTVAQTLMGHNGNRVFLAGGELQLRGNGVFGAATMTFVANFQLDYAILSTDAFSPETGFLLVDQAMAELARLYVAGADRNILVADQSKSQRKAAMKSCDPADIDVFVTDQTPDDAMLTALQDWQIDVLVAPKRKPKT